MKNLKIILLSFFVTIFFAQCSSPTAVVQEFDAHWKNLFFVEKKPDEAKTFCERWLNSSAVDIKIAAHVCLVSLTVDNLKEKGFAPALARIEEALKLNPQNFMLHILRINLHLFYKMDFTDTLQKSLTVFPDASVEQWLDPLEDWFQMQEYEKISQYLNILDAHFPNKAQIQSRLGMIYLFLERMDLAESHLKTAVELDQHDLSTLWSLARIYEMQKQFAKAKTLYEQALKGVSPENQVYPMMQCLYTKFLSESIKDVDGACLYASQNCQEYFEQNCGE